MQQKASSTDRAVLTKEYSLPPVSRALQLSLRRLPRLRSPKRMVMGRPQPRPHRAWPLTTGGSLCHAVLGLLFVRVHFGPPSLEPRTRQVLEKARPQTRTLVIPRPHPLIRRELRPPAGAKDAPKSQVVAGSLAP